MNLLPLLLAAVALLLSAGAFLLVLRSTSARRDPETSSRDQALREDIARIGRRLDQIGEAVERVPEALGAEFAALPAALEGAIEALPVRIAQATGSAESLAATRSAGEASRQAVERLDALHQEMQAASAAQAAASKGIGEALSAAVERSAAETAVQTGTLREISATLSGLAGAVGAVSERLSDPARSELPLHQLEALRQANEVARANGQTLVSASEALDRLVSAQAEVSGREAGNLERARASEEESRQALLAALSALAEESARTREILETLPVRTAEEIATRPAPAPELEELAIAVRDAGALRGDSVRSIADAVSRVAERLESSAEEGRGARQDAADRLSRSLEALESVAAGVREALLPLGDALRGHGEAVVPVVKGLETAQDRLEEAAVSLRANQVEFAASVGVFTAAAQDLSTGLGAFAREGVEDASRDPAAVQQALLESLDRLLGGFAESLRATLVEADLRHREALVEIAARLPDGAKG